MGKPLPMELRRRVVDFVEEGHTHRAAAAQFRVSVKFVNDMVLLKSRTGSLEAKPQGNGGGHGKLAGVAGWIEGRIKEKRDLTLDELVVELRDRHGVEAQPDTQKKTCAPSSRSGLMSHWPAMSGSVAVSPSCVTC
jgi:transposase